ncbi:MAG: ZIP family metal transporter [Candidatus Pacebacteria bacterium]|nr:ZIP family metal transporter [Candidatus Paceibacterota bacterium]
MTLYIFLSAFAIMLASLSGIFFASKHISLFLERNLKVLIAFSTGVFAMITYSLLAESLEHGLSIPALIMSGILGVLFLEIVSHIIPQAHHHHDAVSDHEHSMIDARRVLLGDAAHNIGDGIILVPAYLAGPLIGIGTTVAILFHEMVQEIAEYFILREAGYTVREALTRNFFASGSILIGVGIALFFANTGNLELYMLSFAAGSFMYIIFRDLLPSIYKSIKKNKQVYRFLIAGILGMIVMFGVTRLAPHEQEETEVVHE